MLPSQKSLEMEKALQNLFGFDRRGFIMADQCVFCKSPATKFRDDLSRKEFGISGMCQKCQDKVFNNHED
jgi:hypothetical protein